MRKVLGFVALSLGLVLIAGAALVSWVFAPKLTVLPADTDALRVLGGNAAMLVNPTSLTGPTYGPGVLRDVPVALWHHTWVSRTDGNDAVVNDNRSLHIPGFTIADFTYRFAVDRKSMGASTAFPDVPPHVGLTFNYPIDTQQHDYTGWVADTQRTTRLQYVGEGQRGGEDAYVFKTTVPPTTIRDPQLLKILPATLTKKQILELTPSLQLPLKKLLATQKVLDRLPDPVPMTYKYSLQATYWVAPKTGIILDVARHEVRAAYFVDGNKAVPATTVMDMTYQATPRSLHAAVQDARDGAAKIKLIRTTVPWIGLISGIVLVVVGILLLVIRRRSSKAAAAPDSSEPQTAPVG